MDYNTSASEFYRGGLHGRRLSGAWLSGSAKLDEISDRLNAEIRYNARLDIAKTILKSLARDGYTPVEFRRGSYWRSYNIPRALRKARMARAKAKIERGALGRELPEAAA